MCCSTCRRDPDYGALSRRDRDAMLAGARVEVAPYKRDPADFVLWKPSDEGVIGWDSPWGRGRPGWHIECSAMIRAHLGETIDIHGGGLDLIFPHHENEVAQSRCAHGGAPLARYWVHNGFVDMGAEKMSKIARQHRHAGGAAGRRAIAARRCGWRCCRRITASRWRGPRRADRPEQGRCSIAVPACSAMPSRRQVDRRRVVEALSDDLNTPRARGSTIQARSKRCGRSSGGDDCRRRRARACSGCSNMSPGRVVPGRRRRRRHRSPHRRARRGEGEPRLRDRRPHPRRAEAEGIVLGRRAGRHDMAAGHERAALHDRDPAAGGVAARSGASSSGSTGRARAALADLRQHACRPRSSSTTAAR